MRVEQVAQAVALAGLRGLGQAEKQLAECGLEPARLARASSAAMVCISVSPVPPDFEIATKRVVASGSCASSVAEAVSGSRLSMKCRRGPSRSAPRPGTAWPASCASVCPPRLDPPVPRKTTSVAPSRSRFAAPSMVGEIVALFRQVAAAAGCRRRSARAASRAPLRCASEPRRSPSRRRRAGRLSRPRASSIDCTSEVGDSKNRASATVPAESDVSETLGLYQFRAGRPIAVIESAPWPAFG